MVKGTLTSYKNFVMPLTSRLQLTCGPTFCGSGIFEFKNGSAIFHISIQKYKKFLGRFSSVLSLKQFTVSLNHLIRM